MIDVHPLGDLVMIEVPEIRVERLGIILAKETQPDLEEGKAVAFGPDVPDAAVEEIRLCGGGVIYGALDHEATRWDHDGKKYLFVPAKDLMGALFLGDKERILRTQAALGKWVLMTWEEAKDTILGGLLVRPVERAKAHFTGTVIKAGPRAHEIEEGKRYFFEQFSEFKSWTEDGKRYAFVPVRSIYCEVPERTADVCLAPSEVASPDFEAAMR